MPDLTSDLRAEIEGILRRSDIRHALIYRDSQEGLTAEQIAVRQHTSVSNVRNLARSVEHLIHGTLPTTKSLALTNSYVYRELSNFAPSVALKDYANRCLRALRSINPDVSFDPLGPVTLYNSDDLPQRRKAKQTSLCPECNMTQPCFCD